MSNPRRLGGTATYRQVFPGYARCLPLCRAWRAYGRLLTTGPDGRGNQQIFRRPQDWAGQTRRTWPPQR